MKNHLKNPGFLSCLTMDPKEYFHRVTVAEEKSWKEAAAAVGLPADTTAVEQLKQIGKKDDFYGSEMLWHGKFPDEFALSIGHVSIESMAGFLDCEYATSDGKRGELDRFDFAYMADILREALVVTDDKLKRLRFKRALAWLKLNAPRHTRESHIGAG
jgi:hypothetical protein